MGFIFQLSIIVVTGFYVSNVANSIIDSINATKENKKDNVTAKHLCRLFL